jgi:hypothetical protein
VVPWTRPYLETIYTLRSSLLTLLSLDEMEGKFEDVRMGGRGTSAMGSLNVSGTGITWKKDGVRTRFICMVSLVADVSKLFRTLPK